MYAFEFKKPASLDEAVQLLGGDADAKLMAGGQTFIPTLKQRLAQPTAVIALAGLGELKGIKEEAGGVTIGAMTTHGAVASSDVVKRVIPSLADLAQHIGDPQVRNMGTLGGSIANNDPAADYPGALLALDATVRTNKREIAAADFLTGMFETALADDEIVREVHFKKPDVGSYQKFRNPASRYAIVGSYVVRHGGGVRVAITGAGPCAFRWSDAETALASSFSADAVAGLTVDAGNLNADIHASADYRAHLVKVMTQRAIKACG
jgi:aerobic carbon-monoxide dehydrogenase medium subunit